MPVYRPPFIKQLDGSRYAGLNCTMASAAMAAIRHTEGRNPSGTALWYPTPSYLRGRTGDTSGGTTLAQADSVLLRLYNINLDVEYGISQTQLRQRVTSGAGAILQGGYGPIRLTKYSGSSTFSANHAVYVNEVRWNAQLDRWEWLWYDPLCDGRRSGIPKGPQWVPNSLVSKFLNALMLTPTNRIKSGTAWAALTRDTDVVIERYGGKALTTPVNYQAIRNTYARRAPKYPYDVARPIANGSLWRAYQAAEGHEIDGDKTWYGNADGNQWVPAVRLKRV